MRGSMRERADRKVVLFVGPTMATSPRARALASRFSVRRPVRRHDIARLALSGDPPDVVVIVDGAFHGTLAVGHAEIRDALARGVRVWGLSSMGAIRAREMAPLGMRGFGSVYERFSESDDFQDDEVALLHERAAPYRPVTEPLLHLRAAIDHLVSCGLVGADDARDVVSDLKSRWYGERTVRGTTLALSRRARGKDAASAVARELADFDRFRMKTLDLVRFLEERPWCASRDHRLRDRAPI